MLLKKIQNRAGDFVKGFQGLYQNKFDNYSVIPDGDNGFVIGETVQGREIKIHKFGQNCKVKILFMAAIHGNEVGTIKLMYKLINHLSKRSYLGLEIFVLPCLNLDGWAEAIGQPDYFSGGRIGRFNANDVDLNRNFDTENFRPQNFWYFGNKNVKVYCGGRPFSEPESKCLADFISRENIKIVYSFHSRGKEIFATKDYLAQNLAKDFVAKTGYRYLNENSWQKIGQTGTLKEWCEVRDISYIEIESATRWGSDWKNQREAIISSLKWHFS